ncbi:MAG: hypothetical protein QG597_3826, partial [Actinomycetota bacterium]|nr:hypothetical protein [Actinomycetota bacterium]
AMFERAVANMRTLAEERHRLGTDVEIGVSFIVYPQNHREVYDAAVLARQSGADRIRLKRDISGQRVLDSGQAATVAGLIDRIRAEVVDDSFTLVEVHRVNDVTDLGRRFSACSITDVVAAVGSDGHLYPCNYHPRPGGASYGSAIDSSFAQVWEGVRRARLRDQLPTICPAVCDPFKHRANTLLRVGRDLADARGLGALEREVADLVQARVYDPVHTPGRPR